MRRCPRCNGTGKNPEESKLGWPGEPCYVCLGTGQVAKPEQQPELYHTPTMDDALRSVTVGKFAPPEVVQLVSENIDDLFEDKPVTNPSELEEQIRTALKEDFYRLYSPGFTTDWAAQRRVRGVEIEVMQLWGIQALIQSKYEEGFKNGKLEGRKEAFELMEKGGWSGQ